jgi:RNA polymerase sigma-70 factor (ECF subfamily)
VDGPKIAEGQELLDVILRDGTLGPYAVQAAIAAVHARAERAEDTAWGEIASLYGLLARVTPSPVIELNRAIAVAMVDGVERGLGLIDALEAEGRLDDYHLLAAACAPPSGPVVSTRRRRATSVRSSSRRTTASGAS